MAVITFSASAPPSLTSFGDALDRMLASSRNAAGTVLVNGGAAPVEGSGATVANRCAHCGGRFGMVTHRWWGSKFCRRTCKTACLRELALGRDKICRWFGFRRGGMAIRPLLKEFVRKIPCARQAWPGAHG